MPVVLSLKPVLKCPPQAGLKGFTEETGQPPSSTHTRGGRGFKLRRPEGREGDRKGQKEEASETTYLQNTIRDHAYGVDGGCLLFFVLKFPMPRETLLQQPLQALQASPSLSSALWLRSPLQGSPLHGELHPTSAFLTSSPESLPNAARCPPTPRTCLPNSACSLWGRGAGLRGGHFALGKEQIKLRPTVG